MFPIHRNFGLRRRFENDPPGNRHVETLADDPADENQGAAAFSSAGEADAQPVEWELVLANEFQPDGVGISDRDLVVLASNALLNQSYDFQVTGVFKERSDEIPHYDVIDFHPKLFRACQALRDDPEIGGHARTVMGKANSGMHRHIMASRHFQAAIAFRPNDWRLYEALADSFAHLRKLSRSLASLLMAERIVAASDDADPLGEFRILLKKGQILFHLSRYSEAIGCLEQTMTAYEQVKDQLSTRLIGETAQAQYLLCSAYIICGKNKAKYNHHWAQANDKLESLPPAVQRGMNWTARDAAEDALRELDARNTFVGIFCFMLIVVLAVFAGYARDFERMPRPSIPHPENVTPSEPVAKPQ